MIRGFRFQLHPSGNPSGSPSDSRLDPSLITWLRPFLGVAIVATCVVFVGMAQAQHSGDAGSAPPPPPGPGTLSIQIIAGEQAGTIEGLSIALYALAPDGTPGLTDAVTDAEGRVTFSGISNDPSIVYLIGARYAGIPFGERIAFVAGETEARAEIVVSAPTDRVEGVSLDELRTRIDWMGDRVVVTEILRFTSSGTRVIQLSEDDSTQAIARRRLPPGATDFSAGPSSIGDGLGLENGQVRFWGPLYPGDQRVEYRYSLPLRPGDRTLTLPLELHEDASRVVVVAGTNGMEISGPGFLPSQNVAAETGPTLNSWARTGLSAGERIEIALRLPETRLDPTALTIPRGDVQLELDDTQVTATVELNLFVSPGPPVAGTADEPLLRVTLPTGAELRGVAPDAESMSLSPRADGGFDVLGPIGPGAHSLGFSYRRASGPEGVELDMRFPHEVETLNVLIADTEVALDSDRLHRRRPFRNGTRNYLHREAYNVGPDEVVHLSLVPIRAAGIPPMASKAIAGAAAAGGVFFLMAPLLRAGRREQAADPEIIRIQDEREGVYIAIDDLEHDFETGKLEEADYNAMRDDLRTQAIDLLRIERAGGRTGEPATYAGAAAPSGAAAPDAIAPTGPGMPATGRFCPSCGGQVDPVWKFCSHCGGSLNPGPSAAS